MTLQDLLATSEESWKLTNEAKELNETQELVEEIDGLSQSTVEASNHKTLSLSSELTALGCRRTTC